MFDATQCALGEGPLWHPLRQSLFWFDINNMRMFERSLSDDAPRVWQFDEHVSAAAWVDESRLLIATETALELFDLIKGESQYVTGLESDNPSTRSNDGRADPYGGFWIGTMGKTAQKGAGAIYRYYDGQLRKLFSDITISNSICFAPNGQTAYFCDTPTQIIMKVALDESGWPVGKPAPFVDVAPHHPDGSVVDSNGNLWNAQWGSNRVACYNQDGEFVQAIELPARQISCPAFGGENLDILFATSACENLEDIGVHDGQTFATQLEVKGQIERKVNI